MKVIFALFTLFVIVKGAWWAAAVRPFVLGLGAILGAIDQDVLDVENFEFKWKPFTNSQDETSVPEGVTEVESPSREEILKKLDDINPERSDLYDSEFRKRQEAFIRAQMEANSKVPEGIKELEGRFHAKQPRQRNWERVEDERQDKFVTHDMKIREAVTDDYIHLRTYKREQIR